MRFLNEHIELEGNTAMTCFGCGNCKLEEQVYFCLMKNDFITNQTSVLIVEKPRSGWKKGDSNYEQHRRKSRKEIET